MGINPTLPRKPKPPGSTMMLATATTSHETDAGQSTSMMSR
jgi:hypothetical protein